MRLHTVVHPEHLALAQQFATDGFDRDALVVAADEREDRLPVGRRCLQQRQVADADQAHLERARDGRGGEREHVDVVLQLLHRLLGLHAEALLLVDHQQPEILEHDAVLQQAMGADDAVDLAGLQALDDLLRLLRGEEAAEHLHTNRVAGEAIGERVAVLRGEQRGGREHRHLLAVLDGLERGADGDLGLAEPDVAAHQPIHREGALHVDLDVVDGLALVGRLDEGERLLHLVLPRRVHAERVAGGVDPLLVEHHQLLRDLAHRAAHLASSPWRSRCRRGGAAPASRRPRTGAARRSGRSARTACRRPCSCSSR